MLRDRSTIRVRIRGSSEYDVRFGPLEHLPGGMRDVGLRPGRCLVVTDRNVAPMHGLRLDASLKADGWEPRLLAMPPGEQTKSLAHLSAVYDAALGWGIDRSTPVIALGGGVVGDLAGFAAATLLRGVPLVQVPTTLIAQVDSAIGGKTGINHDAGKNLVGAFHQPKLVWSDPGALATLPEREWASGTAEVVKHALIADPTLFERLEHDMPRFAQREASVVHDVVRAAVQVKAAVVSKDEKENGLRAILNFGHTFGHALEKATGYGVLTHGEAVAIGMRAALYLSRRFSPALDAVRAERLVRTIATPAIPVDLALAELVEAMRSDKKASAGRLRFVLLRRIGEAYVTDEVAPADVDAAWMHALTR